MMIAKQFLCEFRWRRGRLLLATAKDKQWQPSHCFSQFLTRITIVIIIIVIIWWKNYDHWWWYLCQGRTAISCKFMTSQIKLRWETKFKFKWKTTDGEKPCKASLWEHILTILKYEIWHRECLGGLTNPSSNWISSFGLAKLTPTIFADSVIHCSLAFDHTAKKSLNVWENSENCRWRLHSCLGTLGMHIYKCIINYMCKHMEKI